MQAGEHVEAKHVEGVENGNRFPEQLRLMTS